MRKTLEELKQEWLFSEIDGRYLEAKNNMEYQMAEFNKRKEEIAKRMAELNAQ